MKQYLRLSTSFLFLTFSVTCFAKPDTEAYELKLSKAQLSQMKRMLVTSSEQTVEKVPKLDTVFCQPYECFFTVSGKDIHLGENLIKRFLNMMKTASKKQKAQAAAGPNGTVSCTKTACTLVFNPPLENPLVADHLIPESERKEGP